MTLRRLRSFGLLALVLALLGCDTGRKNPPDVIVRVVNVAPSFPSLEFRREQTRPTDLTFNSSNDAVYDEDTYDFYVDVRNLARIQSDQALTFAKQLTSGTSYTFVLLEAGGQVEHAILESPFVPLNATDTQVQAMHATEGAPAVDVYLEPPGTNILAATRWGSIGFRGTIPAKNVPTGDYEITITSAGNPADVLLTSSPFTLAAAASTTFVISPDGGDGIEPFAVTIAQAAGNTGALVDRNAPSLVRVINGATDKAPRDVAFNGQFSPPLFSAVPFAAPSAYLPLAPGSEIPVNVTPPGNPGVLELDQKVASAATHKFTLLFTGDPGTLTHTFATDDNRRIVNEAKIVFYNAAPQFTSLELVIVLTGSDTDPTTVQPASLLLPTTISTPIPAIPQGYDVYLREGFTTTLVAGPVSVNVAGGGIYGVLATNGASSTTADITLIDDFQ